ncbi:MAG: tetratricopeptide repeat protein [Myxococcales bacterium]|nr:tetratricopeptide repeat protein [Myxococcales bacterium]
MIVLLLLACTAPLERGETALARDDLFTAEKEFRQALDADPRDPDALYGLGWTFHKAGERDAARDAFAQLVRLHPELSLGYRGLGSVLAGEGNLAGARAALAKALERAPRDPGANQSLALVDLAEGKAADSLTRLDGLAAAGVHGSELSQARAAALVQLGRTEEAMAVAEEAVVIADSTLSLAAARLTWVQALLQHSDARRDPDRCGVMVPALGAWYDAADHVVDQVQATGALRAAVVDARREVRRRRGWLEDTCVPGGK